jgi:hypothetical protein
VEPGRSSQRGRDEDEDEDEEKKRKAEQDLEWKESLA